MSFYEYCKFFSALPLDLQHHILGFIQPTTAEEANIRIQQISALMNENSSSAINEKIQELVTKYRSFSDLSEDVQQNILRFVEPKYGVYASVRDVKKTAQEVYALMNKTSRAAVTEKLRALKKEAFEAKYCAYRSDFEAQTSLWQMLQKDPSMLDNPHLGESRRKFLDRFEPSQNPLLLDALFTGRALPFANHTHPKYTKEVEDDIKEIVRLMPKSLYYSLGNLRLRTRIPPLGAAVVNENIPISLIEWLFQNGADPNTRWGCVNSEKMIRIINCLKYDDIWFSFSGDRRQALIEIFERYGAIEENFKSR